MALWRGLETDHSDGERPCWSGSVGDGEGWVANGRFLLNLICLPSSVMVKSCGAVWRPITATGNGRAGVGLLVMVNVGWQTAVSP